MSAGFQGARALVNEEVYAQAFAESIVTLVLENRKQLARELRAHYDNSLTAYPVERGIADANAYHQTGSVYFGIALARQAIERGALLKRGENADPTRSTDAQLTDAQAKVSEAQRLLTEHEKQKATLETERTNLTASLTGRLPGLVAAKGVNRPESANLLANAMAALALATEPQAGQVPTDLEWPPLTTVVRSETERLRECATKIKIVTAQIAEQDRILKNYREFLRTLLEARSAELRSAAEKLAPGTARLTSDPESNLTHR